MAGVHENTFSFTFCSALVAKLTRSYLHNKYSYPYLQSSVPLQAGAARVAWALTMLMTSLVP